jgi:hypothetical protein
MFSFHDVYVRLNFGAFVAQNTDLLMLIGKKIVYTEWEKSKVTSRDEQQDNNK